MPRTFTCHTRSATLSAFLVSPLVNIPETLTLLYEAESTYLLCLQTYALLRLEVLEGGGRVTHRSAYAFVTRPSYKHPANVSNVISHRDAIRYELPCPLSFVINVIIFT
jgi:hypothetical protein